MKQLSVIIVNWNTREHLARCLRSLEEYTPTLRLSDPSTGSGGAGEVWVVDNASSDGSCTMVRDRFPWVHLIENTENLGFARANNQALRQVRGCYVTLLNSDTEIHPAAFETMMNFMAEHPGAGGCGPRLLNGDGSLQPSCHPLLTPEREFWRLMFLDKLWRCATYPQSSWDAHRPRRVEVIKGACFMLRREALKEVGFLDDRYFMYTEEMDLCYRLLQANWELWWVPEAVVTHYGEASTRQIAEGMYVQLYRSKAQFHRKFGGERRAARFKGLLWLAYAPRWFVLALTTLIKPDLVDRARTYRRLLSELRTF
jgi:hypothetical protein